MKSLLLRAAPLALCMALGQPAFSQTATAPATIEQPEPLTSEQWREDLAFMVAEMKRRHPNLYHSVSREAFEAAVADLHARIPAMERNEIIVGLMRIAAMIGDGHTRVDPRKDSKFGFPSFPLKLYLFEDGLFVRAARPDFASLVGAEIVDIGGVPVGEAIRRTHAISSVDNVIGYRLFAPLYLNMPDILQALELSPSRGSATFKLRKNGRTWTATVPSGQVDPIWPPDTDISLVTPEGWVDGRSGSQPLWLQEPLDHHRLIELPEQKALYAQLNMVTNEKDQTLTQFGKAIAARAAATNPTSIVLDLRLNLGGNGGLRNGFVREVIRAEDEDTRLFVLTWRGTFSASQFILDDLDRLSRAIFVGEPASSKPSSFGDAYRTPLPNSGINIRTSIKWWQAGQNFDPWTFIDESTPLTYADYAAGHDPALDAALSYAPRPRLSELLMKTSGAEEMRETLSAYLSDPRTRYSNINIAILAAAEELAAAKRTEEALHVAELATRRSPGNLSAQLILGILAERAGRVDIAVDAARRAIEIDPNDREARSLLERAAKDGSR